MIGLFMVLPILVVYGQDLTGATPILLGLALGIYGLTQSLLQIPLGLLSDHIGRKPVMLAGLVIFAMGSLVAAFAESALTLIIGRALQGAGAIAGVVMALLADSTRPDQRTKAMAIVGISIGASFALALIVGPLLASWGGLKTVFLSTAGLAVLGILIVIWRLPFPAMEQALSTDIDAREWHSNPDLWRLNTGVFALHFVLTALFLIIPITLLRDVGLARESHWTLYAPVLLLSIVGLVPLMRFAERGKRPKSALAIALLALLLSLFIFLVQGAQYLHLFIGMWCFFVGFNYLEASLPSLLSRRVTQHRRGAAMGSFSTAQFLGAFMGGALGGAIVQELGAEYLLCVSVLMLIGWGAWVFSSHSLFELDGN